MLIIVPSLLLSVVTASPGAGYAQTAAGTIAAPPAAAPLPGAPVPSTPGAAPLPAAPVPSAPGAAPLPAAPATGAPAVDPSVPIAQPPSLPSGAMEEFDCTQAEFDAQVAAGIIPPPANPSGNQIITNGASQTGLALGLFSILAALI